MQTHRKRQESVDDPTGAGCPTRHRGLGRCLLVGAGAWGVAGALVWLAAPLLASRDRRGGRVRVRGAAGGAAARAATALCGLWLGVVATVVVVDAARARAPRAPARLSRGRSSAGCSRPAAPPWSPGWPRPAMAADRRPERPPAVARAARWRDSPCPTAPWPAPRARAGCRSHGPGDGPRGARGRGARRRLPVGDRRPLAARATPTTPRSTRRWQQIFALNRSVIGTDPDLIRPGAAAAAAPVLRGVAMPTPLAAAPDPPCRSPASRARSPSTLARRPRPAGDRLRARPPGRRRGAHRRAGAPAARAVVPPLRPGGRRDRQRRPSGHPGAAVDHPGGLRLARAPRPAGRRARRPPPRPGPARARASAPRCSASAPASSPPRSARGVVHVRHGERSRAIAARFELINGRWQCSALEFA